MPNSPTTEQDANSSAGVALNKASQARYSDNNPFDQHLALPAPTTEPTATIDMSSGSQQKVALDHLGPMIVNTDGTLSRIQNWQEMSEIEREKTMRIIAKRNRARSEALQQSQV